ncbi:MAG: hypothetical protein ATN35_03335 [Epulopiscium sp. Nele67-Bin004]|nr:MAG: hypothetical protein ATN35_03335 [Epulopiscium sp. Nele67-Bin004]
MNKMLKFKPDINLEQAISAMQGYSINHNVVKFNEKNVGRLVSNHNFYKYFLEPNGIEYQNIISKKLLPNEAIFIDKTQTLHIIRKKFADKFGITDEKLLTCSFQCHQYQKLIDAINKKNNLNVKLTYSYVLNDWFKQPMYEDTLEYITDVGCYYYFNEISAKTIFGD